MTRYALHVPLLDNEGRDLAELHADVRALLGEHFPGFTELPSEGAWLAGEHVCHEPLRIYVVDSDDVDAHEVIRKVGRKVKTEAQQDAVYLTAQAIQTELI